MPTNDERREVAAKLRELAQESARCGDDGVGERACRVLLGPRVDLLDVVDAHFPLAHLADLIEPEERTCHNISTVPCKFTCSECHQSWREAKGNGAFAYCPCCGAMVMDQ